jgi:3-oxoacyl-[acyl-carrier protein] reductase
MSPTVLVTGASRGIGKATAELLLSRGYTVHGTYNQSRAEAEKLEAKYPNLRFHHADFTDTSSVDKLLSSLASIPLDGLVNNAGIFEMDGFAEWDYDLWRAVFEVNLIAPIRLTMGLRDQIISGGSIVNVSSLDGMVGSFHSMAYSASKSALINLTMSLGNNFGRRSVRVNALAPGWINTGMATPESYQAVEITPLGRNGKPEEVACLIAFLLSNEASFINGATIVIDGGFGNVDYIMLQESKRTEQEGS